MKNRKLTTLGLGVVMAAIMVSSVHAKKTYPAEIMGRDLNYIGLGWLGHVGIATASMSSANGMSQNASQVIEILNEPTVVNQHAKMTPLEGKTASKIDPPLRC